MKITDLYWYKSQLHDEVSKLSNMLTAYKGTFDINKSENPIVIQIRERIERYQNMIQAINDTKVDFKLEIPLMQMLEEIKK